MEDQFVLANPSGIRCFGSGGLFGINARTLKVAGYKIHEIIANKQCLKLCSPLWKGRWCKLLVDGSSGINGYDRVIRGCGRSMVEDEESYSVEIGSLDTIKENTHSF